MSDRKIEYTLKGKDELSPVAKHASEAVSDLNDEAERLGKALDEANEARGLIASLKSTARELDQADASIARTSTQIEKLRADLEAAPKSSHLVSSLKRAEQQLEKSSQWADSLRPKLADLSTALSLAGVDTANLADEEERLTGVVSKTRTALAATSKQLTTAKAADAAASRASAEAEQDAATATADLEKKKRAAAVAARELLQRQREGTAVTAEHSNQIGISIKRLATYAVGLLGVGQLLGKLRAGITAVFRSGNDNEQALAQLNAALASTGNAAGLTAEQLQALAAQLRSNSLFSTEQIVAAETRLLSYTDVAGEQFPRAMQIVIDQAQRLGMGVEQSAELVGKALQSPADAMTALGRQGFKLQAGQKELLQQMVATGRTAEAQAVIMDMLAESYGGAAASARLNTATGLWQRLTNQLGDFGGQVAASGAFDYLKLKLREVGDYLQALADDGTLERWARNLSDRFISFAKSVEAAGQWVVRHSTEIKALAAAYAALKLAGMVSAMANWAAAVQASSVHMRALTVETNLAAAAQARLGAAQVLGGGLAKLGGLIMTAAGALKFLAVRLAGWAGLAVLAADAGKPLGEMFAKMSPAVREAEASIARINQRMREQYEAAQKAAAALEGANNLQRKGTSELRRASEEEREAYKLKLQAVEDYQRAQLKAAIYGAEVGALSKEELARARDGLASVRKELQSLEKSAGFAGDAFKGRLTVGALELVEQFNQLRRSGSDADEVLTQLGKDFDPTNADQLRDMGVLLQYLGQYGIVSGDQIENFLVSKLEKLSQKDLLRVQAVGKDVFQGLGRGAEALGLVVDASLTQALKKLGIDLEEIATGFDKATREALAAFDEVASVQDASGRSAQNAAAVIAAAYIAARQKINDPAALAQLDQAFRESAKTAGMTATQISTSMAQARGETDNAASSVRDMGDALTRIGAATSTMELANIGVAAAEAFGEARMSAVQFEKVQTALNAKTAELRRGTDELVQAQGKLTKSQKMQNDAMQDGIVTSEELRRVSGQRMEEERRGGDQAMQDRRKGNEEAKRDMGAMEGFFGGVLSRARQPLAAMSAAALEAFDRLRGISSVDMSIDTSSLDATRESLERVSRSLGEVQQAMSSPMLGTLGRWQLENQQASLQTQQAYLGQKASLQSLMADYESGVLTTKQFISAAKSARQAMGLLDDADLSGLNSAINSAQQSMSAMGQTTRGTLESLQDELDQLEGRTADIERRRFDGRERDLRTQLAAAQATGDSQAVANANRALGMLRQIEAATEQQRQTAEQKTRQEEIAKAVTTQAPASQAGPAKIIRLETPTGKTFDFPANDSAAETRLLDVLADAGLRAI